jgi:hypothetical protein
MALSAQEQYRQGQDALFALLPQGILESEEGQDWYNRRADQLVENLLKGLGREQDKAEQNQQ